MCERRDAAAVPALKEQFKEEYKELWLESQGQQTKKERKERKPQAEVKCLDREYYCKTKSYFYGNWSLKSLIQMKP